MDLKTYIESGILELYVLGQLSPEEEKEVQDMQAKHIEIQREIHEISLSLEKYAQLNAIKAPAQVADRIFENLPSKSSGITSSVNNTVVTPTKTGLSWNTLTTFFALLCILGFLMYLIQKIKLFHLFGIANSIVFLTVWGIFNVCFGVAECSFG